MGHLTFLYVCENYMTKKKKKSESKKIAYKLVVIKVNRLHKGYINQTPRSPNPGKSVTSNSKSYP